MKPVVWLCESNFDQLRFPPDHDGTCIVVGVIPEIEFASTKSPAEAGERNWNDQYRSVGN